MVTGGADDPLKTHRREIIVVFLDLRGFTAFVETAEPEELMAVLREYHAAMGQLILEHEGTLERFTGDGMMVFFNDPVMVPNGAERAIRMAVEMRDRVKEMAARWLKLGYEVYFCPLDEAALTARHARVLTLTDLIEGVAEMP